MPRLAHSRLRPACLPAGATRTFYAYHVFANGATDSRTMSLGPHNHAKMPAPGRTVNPGIVVAGVEDQGKKVGGWLACCCLLACLPASLLACLLLLI